MLNTSDYIKRLNNGDIPAFEYLYRNWNRKLYNFVLKTSDNDLYYAEDVVQTVFVKIWEKRAALDSNKNFEAYIYITARNMLKNIHQHKTYESLYEKDINRLYDKREPSSKYCIIDELDARFLEKFINSHIDELPPVRRQIFLLSRKYFLTNRQIAKKLNISTYTVDSQMTKALSYLRHKLSTY